MIGKPSRRTQSPTLAEISDTERLALPEPHDRADHPTIETDDVAFRGNKKKETALLRESKRTGLTVHLTAPGKDVKPLILTKETDQGIQLARLKGAGTQGKA
jgi:hypothetical protein